MKHLFCFLWAIIVSLNLYSQNTKIIIDNQTPGWLSSKLTYSQQQVVEDLTITGYVNKTDMFFVSNLIRNQKLMILDVTNVTLISSEKGENYIWSDFLNFGDAKILQKISMPKVVEGVIWTVSGSDYSSIISSHVDTLEIGYEDMSVLSNFQDSRDGESICKYPPHHLILLDGVKILPDGCFKYSDGYVDPIPCCIVSLPNTITHIGGRTFDSSFIFEDFTFPNSIEYLGRHPVKDEIAWYSPVHGLATDNCWAYNSTINISHERFEFPQELRFYNSLHYEGSSLKGYTVVAYDNYTSDTIIVGSKCDTLFAKLNAKVGYFYNEKPVKFWSSEDVKIDLLYVPVGCLSAYNDAYPNVKNIKEFGVGNTTITMGSSGIATYSNNSDLNFTGVSGLKAYIGSGYNPATGNLTMTRVYEVPAGEGLILKGATGSYDVPYEETSAYYANLLVGVPTATTVSPTDGIYTNFILANDAVKGIGFYPLASAGEIGPNKAYLQLPTSILPAAARSLRMVFEDEEEEVTGVNALNDKCKMKNDKAVYDLQGRRVVKPTRGLYIKDGKKIMVK